MLLFGGLRFTADRRGGKLGRWPDGSFLARPPTHTVGHFLPLVTGSFRAFGLGMHAPSSARWGCRPMACKRGSRGCDLGPIQAPHGVAIARSDPVRVSADEVIE
jgi:hypothetical protein